MSSQQSVHIKKNNIIDAIEQLVNKDQHIIRQLDRILSEFEKSHKNWLYFKSAGVGSSALGAAGLVLAPFTAGASLTLTVGGIISGGVGAVTSIITEIIDGKESKKVIGKVIELADTRRQFVGEMEDISKYLMIYAKIIQQTSPNDISEEEAKHIALRTHCEQHINFQCENDSLGFVSPASEFSCIQMPAVVSDWKTAGCSGTHEVPLVIGAVVNILARETSTLGAKTLGKVFVRGSLVVGIGVAAIDVFSTVREWNTEHPTVKKILDLKKDLNDEIEMCKKNIEIIKRYAAEGKTMQIDELKAEIERLKREKDEAECRFMTAEEKRNLQYREYEERLRRIEEEIANRNRQ